MGDEFLGALSHQSPAGAFAPPADATSLVFISVLLSFFAPVPSYSHLLCFCLSLILICSVALTQTSLFLRHQLFFYSFQTSFPQIFAIFFPN